MTELLDSPHTLQPHSFWYNNVLHHGDQVKKLEIDRESLINLGSRVKKTRKTLGVSQKDFAASLEMSGSYLSEIEHGNAAPGYEFFYKISLKYNVNPDWLFHGTGTMIREEPVKPINEEKEYIDNIETVNDVVWFMEHSDIFKYYILGEASRFFSENEETIRRDIQLRRKKRRREE